MIASAIKKQLKQNFNLRTQSSVELHGRMFAMSVAVAT
ncbi:hypothetical protein N183_22750 [Sinorhizobium sp. Sb3]|nr:hypothetical protein N183_22750 [Sinorhizobium sp. Sb3]